MAFGKAVIILNFKFIKRYFKRMAQGSRLLISATRHSVIKRQRREEQRQRGMGGETEKLAKELASYRLLGKTSLQKDAITDDCAEDECRSMRSYTCLFLGYVDGDHVDGEDAKPDDDGVDELEPRVRPTVEPSDLGQRNDAKAETEEDGED